MSSSQPTNPNVAPLSWGGVANPAYAPLQPVEQTTHQVARSQLQSLQRPDGAGSKRKLDDDSKFGGWNAPNNRVMAAGAPAAAAAAAGPAAQNTGGFQLLGLPQPEVIELKEKFDIALTGKTSPAALKNYMYQLGIELMQNEALKNPDACSIVSPFSLMQVLGMLLNGMSDPKDLAQVGLQPSDLDGLNASLSQISAEVCDTGSEESSIRSYNALVMLGNDFLKEFQAMLQANYSAEVFTIKDPQEIIKWLKSKNVPEKFFKLLCDILTPALTNLSKDGGALINASIFEAIWDLHFDKKNTTDGIFTSLCGERVNAKIMHHYGKYLRVSFGPNYTAVVLPYKGTDLSRVIVIPNNPYDMEKIQRELPTIINSALQKVGRVYSNFHYPRQKFNYQMDVFEGLRNAGYPTRVALNKMMPGATITSAKQFVVGESNEEGTKLVAMMMIGMAKSAGPSAPPVDINGARPHFSAIVQKGTPFALIRNSGKEFLEMNSGPSMQRSSYGSAPVSSEYVRKNHPKQVAVLDEHLSFMKTMVPTRCKHIMIDNVQLLVMNYTRRHSVNVNRYGELLINGRFVMPRSNSPMQFSTKENTILVVFEKGGLLCGLQTSFHDKSEVVSPPLTFLNFTEGDYYRVEEHPLNMLQGVLTTGSLPKQPEIPFMPQYLPALPAGFGFTGPTPSISIPNRYGIYTGGPAGLSPHYPSLSTSMPGAAAADAAAYQPRPKAQAPASAAAAAGAGAGKTGGPKNSVVELDPVLTNQARFLSRARTEIVSLESIKSGLAYEFDTLAKLTFFKETSAVKCYDVTTREGTQLVIVNSSNQSVHFNLDRELVIGNLPVLYPAYPPAALQYTLDNCILFVLNCNDRILIVDFDFPKVDGPKIFTTLKKEATCWIVEGQRDIAELKTLLNK